MLAHSPHIHLLFVTSLSLEITAEKGKSLALPHHNRVGRIPLFMPVLNLQKLIIMAMELTS
jgi:hypothetical protein